MPRKQFDVPQMQMPKPIPGESTDEHFERVTKERSQQIGHMLDKLDVSQNERQFIVSTAERVVDMICDDYLKARKDKNLGNECISAAATVAMMIVYDC